MAVRQGASHLAAALRADVAPCRAKVVAAAPAEAVGQAALAELPAPVEQRQRRGNEQEGSQQKADERTGGERPANEVGP